MLYNQRLTVLLLITTLVLLLMPSSAIAQEDDEEEIVRVTGIRLEDNKTEMTLVLGESEELTAIVYPLDATDRRVAWSNSDSEVVELNTKGYTAEVKSRSIGESTITVSTVDRGFWIECQVEVIRLGESIGIDPKSVTLAPGETTEMEAWVLPRDADEQGIRWESADSGIATVDQEGKVTAKHEGEARIIARAVEEEGIRTYSKVTVKEEPDPLPEVNDNDDDLYDEKDKKDEEDGLIMPLIFGSGGGIIVIGALFFALRNRRKSHPSQATASAFTGSSLGSPVLIGVSGLYAGQKTDLSHDEIIIGRDPQAARVVYPSESDQISRKHCKIYFDRNMQQFILEDTSSNGTFLADGRRLKQYQKYPLKPGDTFTLAQSGETFSVELE